ncbi:MAG: hypothetical protein WC655_29045 [Candidatus Hydrogenedentales bacterium]|jgi:hypothetical protein
MDAESPDSSKPRKRRLRRVLVLAIIVLVGAGAVLAARNPKYLRIAWLYITAPKERPQLSADNLELIIRSDKLVYAVGETPRIYAALVNKSGRSLYLAQPLEGSDIMRFPLVQFAVTPPKDALPPQKFGRCGNTAGITSGAFVCVPPGGSLQLSNRFLDEGLPALLGRGAGEYRFRLSYSTNSTDKRSWSGTPATADESAKIRVEPFLSHVPRITVHSNELVLRFDMNYDYLLQLLEHGDRVNAFSIIRQYRSAPGAQFPEYLARSLVDALQRDESFQYQKPSEAVLSALELYVDCAPPEVVESTWNRCIANAIRGDQPDLSFPYTSKYLPQLVRLIAKSPIEEREARLHLLLCAGTSIIGDH